MCPILDWLRHEERVVNNNLPFGELAEPKNNKVYVNYEVLKGAEFAENFIEAEFFRNTEVLDKKLNYYTPYGHNTFIGDVVNFYNKGFYRLGGCGPDLGCDRAVAVCRNRNDVLP